MKSKSSLPSRRGREDESAQQALQDYNPTLTTSPVVVSAAVNTDLPQPPPSVAVLSIATTTLPEDWIPGRIHARGEHIDLKIQMGALIAGPARFHAVKNLFVIDDSGPCECGVLTCHE